MRKFLFQKVLHAGKCVNILVPGKDKPVLPTPFSDDYLAILVIGHGPPQRARPKTANLSTGDQALRQGCLFLSIKSFASWPKTINLPTFTRIS